MNNKKYWLRGGIIASIFSIVFFCLLFSYFGRESDLVAVLNFPGFIYLLGGMGGSYSEIEIILMRSTALLINVATYFIVGVILGWIYGKFKKA
jgi:hypothetical protein